MGKVTYGVVSTAQVVPRFVRAVQESEEGEVIAIASRGIEKALKMAKELDIPRAYASYDALFEDEEVDVIYIATYNKGHYPVAKQALLAGKNVLLEKPFTLKADEARELFALAKEKGLFLMEAQKAVFLPTSKKVQELISEGRIGKVVMMQSVTAYAGIDHVTWFRDLDAGGGTLHFMGPYPIAYMQYVTGKEIIDYAGVAEFPSGQSDSQSNLTFKFSSGILANVYLTTEVALPKTIRIIGTEGTIEVPEFWKAKKIFLRRFEEDEEVFEYAFTNEFVFEVNHVNSLILEGKKESPVMTPERTIKTVEITENLYKKWTE